MAAKRLLSLAASLVFASILGTAPANAQTVRIGLSLPLSGDAGLLSEQFQQGAALAVETLAPEGDVELFAADDGCDADLSELAAQDLKTAGVVAITGLLCNDAVRAVAREFASEAIPLIIAGARSDRIFKDNEKEGWNLWRMAPGDRDASLAAFQLLENRWADIPWAIVDDGTVMATTLAGEFRAMMEGAGLPPQYTDVIRPAQSTQSSLIRRLRQAGAKAVFVAAGAEDTALLWREIVESGGDIEIAGGENLSVLPYARLEEAVPDGLLAVMPPPWDTVPAVETIRQQLEERGIEPEPYVFLGYAALELTLSALRATPQQTSQVLAETSFQTILGVVDFGTDGTNTINPYRLFTWRDGGFEEGPQRGPPTGDGG